MINTTSLGKKNLAPVIFLALISIGFDIMKYALSHISQKLLHPLCFLPFCRYILMRTPRRRKLYNANYEKILERCRVGTVHRRMHDVDYPEVRRNTLEHHLAQSTPTHLSPITG